MTGQVAFPQKVLHLSSSQGFLLTSGLGQDHLAVDLTQWCYLLPLLVVVAGLVLASRCNKAIQGA